MRSWLMSHTSEAPGCSTIQQLFGSMFFMIDPLPVILMNIVIDDYY